MSSSDVWGLATWYLPVCAFAEESHCVGGLLLLGGSDLLCAIGSLHLLGTGSLFEEICKPHV